MSARQCQCTVSTCGYKILIQTPFRFLARHAEAEKLTPVHSDLTSNLALVGQKNRKLPPQTLNGAQHSMDKASQFCSHRHSEI